MNTDGPPALSHRKKTTIEMARSVVQAVQALGVLVIAWVITCQVVCS